VVIVGAGGSERTKEPPDELLARSTTFPLIRLMDRVLPDRRWPADFFAMLVAAAIPWSTTATAALAVLWFIALAPIIHRADAIYNLRRPATALPLLLGAFAIASIAWSDGNSSDIVRGIKPFLRLMLLPLLFAQYRHSDRGIQVLKAFLASCSLLLLFSFATTIYPPLWREDNPGVPIRDQTAQSAEFALCFFALLYLGLRSWQKANYVLGGILAICSLLFLYDMLFIATSRTELVILPVLVAMLFYRLYGLKSLPIAFVTIGLLGAIIWTSSSYVRGRIQHGVWELQQFEEFDRPTSIGLRLAWWRKSIDFVSRAPILGHGVGSIEGLFKESSAGKSGASGVAINNPHNQFFAVSIPLGLAGLAILLAMLWYHYALFRGDGWLPWLGAIVVIRTLVGSIFYSQLLDFTESWIYVWAVGVIGGSLARRADAHGDEPPSSLPSPNRV